jgi:ribosome-interacting GTPase 1
LASSFHEAEFWGRPLNEPQKVKIQEPLIGDEDTIEKILFGRRVSHEDITMEQRWRLDARMKRIAEKRGYDSILLMTRKAFAKFRLTGQLPRSIELNILDG